MAAAEIRKPSVWIMFWPWVWVAVSSLKIATDRWWPGSLGATLVAVGFYSFIPIWLGLRIRTGYLRRRPYWTRESWIRYLRLAAMPVIALTVFLAISAIDHPLPSVMGAPGSGTRHVWIVALVGMMLFGAIGLVTAIEWMARGEPSEQFTRTRWFQRRRPT